MDALMDEMKFFSVEQAERALPLVRRIVDDIVQTVARHKELTKERLAIPPHPNPGSEAEERVFRLDRDLAEVEKEFRRFALELQAIGVELKDPELGLIDFYSRFNDQVVYLCWRRDEGEQIKYWHRLDGGFRGRQTITENLRGAFLGR